LASLVKKIDDAANANKDAKMGSFVVVMTDDTDKMEKSLKEMAEKEKLTKVVLTIDSAAGPDDYKISKDADVTVVLYSKKEVKKNLAFAKGKFDAKAVEAVVGELKSILPEKKK
jgi:hypothetical protein